VVLVKGGLKCVAHRDGPARIVLVAVSNRSDALEVLAVAVAAYCHGHASNQEDQVVVEAVGHHHDIVPEL